MAAGPRAARMQNELKRQDATVDLLWREHREVHVGDYSYSFCHLYEEWKQRENPVMRQGVQCWRQVVRRLGRRRQQVGNFPKSPHQRPIL